jgi:hypothetical protein
MCAIQNYPQNQQQNPQQQPPPLPQPKYHFRWAVLGVPLTILLFLYVIKNIEPSFNFDDILGNLGVIHRTKYARLVCMAVICITFLLIVKLFRNHPDE